MSKHKKDKGRHLPWISLYRHTWKFAAWKALSVSARAPYIELAANDNTKAQNSIFHICPPGAEQLNA